MSPIKDITTARNHIYLENAQFWQYYRDHYDGGPSWGLKVNPIYRPLLGYATDPQKQGLNRYITQHELESSSAYLVRLYKAPFCNLCGPAVDLLAGTVGQPGTVTLTLDTQYQPLLDDADLMGSSFSQFMTCARAHAAIYGHTFVLVDSTKSNQNILTQADIVNQGIRPYYREILPPDMLSWRLDMNGEPIELIFRVAIESPNSLLEGVSTTNTQLFEYRYWSRDAWTVFRPTGETFEIFDSGTNPVGEIPVAVLYHKKAASFLGESLLKESAKFSQMLSNWLSNLDQTMAAQSFSQACVRSETAPSVVGVGTDRILHLRPTRKENETVYGEEDFFFRAPDSKPLQTMWDSFFRVIDLANESMSLNPEATSDKSHPESGISRAWRFHSMEKRLVQMAVNEQECARNMFYFAGKWMGQDFTGTILYGIHFDLTALEDDISAMLRLQQMGMPPSAEVEMKKGILKKAMPNLDPAVQGKMDAEVQAQQNITKLEDRRTLTDILDNQG